MNKQAIVFASWNFRVSNSRSYAITAENNNNDEFTTEISWHFADTYRHLLRFQHRITCVQLQKIKNQDQKQSIFNRLAHQLFALSSLILDIEYQLLQHMPT